MNQTSFRYGWALIALAALPNAVLGAEVEESQSDANSTVYVRVYNVADLAVYRVTPGNPDKVQLDFSIVTALIKFAIAPDSWDKEDEPVAQQARISPFHSNRSLVISQTERNHQKVQELLRRLRGSAEKASQRELASEVRTFTDKIARDPRVLGIKGAPHSVPQQ